LKLDLFYSDSFPEHIVEKGILRKKIRLIASAIGKGEQTRFKEIEIIFLDAVELRSYNKMHLGHDYETDILTFDLSESEMIDGQLMISRENVLKNSKRFRTDFENELMRVIVHGLLHLAGYNDRSERQRRIMRKKENEYLKLQNYAGKSN
jgi:rRNA maturation RNase YbeY